MDWLRSEDLKEEKNVTAPSLIIAVKERVTLCRWRGAQGVPLGMHRISPECPGSGRGDRSVAADVLLREQPDEEDDEEEGDGKEKEGDEDDDTDDGYSERGCLFLYQCVKDEARTFRQSTCRERPFRSLKNLRSRSERRFFASGEH